MATLQELIAASIAANPNAAGANGSYFTGPVGDPLAQLGLTNPDGTPTGKTMGGNITVTRNPGSTPDYGNMILSDPLFAQSQADARAVNDAAAASRKAQTIKILAQLGLIPDTASAMNSLGLNSSYLQSDLDPVARQLADQMTKEGLSTTAHLNQDTAKATMSLKQLLAARGGLQSGALGLGLTDELQRDKQARFDALQQALSQVGGVQGDYASRLQQSADQLRTAAQDATTRQIGLHPAVGADTVDAHYDPGSGLYVDGDGNYYTADGKATAKPGATAPPPKTTAAAPSTSVPQSSTFGGSNGPYVGTLPAAPAAVPAPAPPVTPTPAAVPQSVTFGGSSGPYVGTLPKPPASQAVKNSLMKRLNLPE